MEEKKHMQVLESIVKKLNEDGRDLSVHDDHDKEEFVILRIKEGNKSVKIPFTKIRLYEFDEGETVYETPVRSNGRYGYTSDKDISFELKEHYQDKFEIFPAVYKSLRELSKVQENLLHQFNRRNKNEKIN